MLASKKILAVASLLSLVLSGCSDSENTTPDLLSDFESEKGVTGLWDLAREFDEPYDALLHITADLKFREFIILSPDDCYTQFDDGEIFPLGDDGNGVDVYTVEFEDVGYDEGYIFYLDPISDTNDVLYLKRGLLEARRLTRVENISPLDINICE